MVTGGLTSAAAAVPPHPLHHPYRTWPLTSCYADAWIELLHGLGLDPRPAMAFTADVAWEGDQFTFLKPCPADLDALYGLQVHETVPWDSLERHVSVQAGQDRPVLLEVDAYNLPDLAGRDYRTSHANTIIAVVGMDPRARKCQYIHNASRSMLTDDDYDAVFATARHGALPLRPRAETVTWQRRREPAWTLPILALDCLRQHVSRRGRRVHVPAFRATFTSQLEALFAAPAGFDLWAFHTMRQFGGAAELLSDLLAWLGDAHPEGGSLEVLRADALSLANNAKALQFRVARLVSRRRVDACDDLLSTLEATEAALAAGMERHFG